jgi:two-component system, chemotaxis family, response regulator Rcp1
MARILLVEDNPADVSLFREALSELSTKHKVDIAINGQEAIDLIEESRGSGAPDVVFLDINLPLKTGHDVLRHLKSDSDLRRIPVVILTGSKASEDVLKAYNAYANAYVTKPNNLDEFIQVVERMEAFWFQSATLPSDVERLNRN